MGLSGVVRPKIVARDWVYPVTEVVNIGLSSLCDIDLGHSRHLETASLSLLRSRDEGMVARDDRRY